MNLGLGAICLEVASKMVYFAYDKGRNIWKFPDMEVVGAEPIVAAAHNQAQRAAASQQVETPSIVSERRSAFGPFANTARQLDGAMAAVKDNTPELTQQQPQQQVALSQPRPQQTTVATQKQRLEIGQQMGSSTTTTTTTITTTTTTRRVTTTRYLIRLNIRTTWRE